MAVAVADGVQSGETNVDDKIGTPGTSSSLRRPFISPNAIIDDARQRWLFRMVHSPAPLQERMALIWHHHFATAYSKIAGSLPTRGRDAHDGRQAVGGSGAGSRGRSSSSASMRSATSAICSSRWPRTRRCSCWLDGRLNIERAQPQENFGRELMELFTFGVEHYLEADVYAAARVFTGLESRDRPAREAPATRSIAFSLQSPHSTTPSAKDFSFPIYSQRQPAASRRERPASGHAGRARSDQRARLPSGDRAAAWRAASGPGS